MSAFVLYGLVLFSAVAHATWNSLVKSAGNRVLTMASIRFTGLVLGARATTRRHRPLCRILVGSLAAAKTLPLGPIVALRESSVIFGTLIGTFMFREGFGFRRIAASTFVVSGIALLP